MLFQFGCEDVIFDDLTAKADIKGEIAEYVKISVQVLNYAGASDFKTKSRQSYKQTVTLAVGAVNLHKDSTPYSTRVIDVTWKGSKILRCDGYAMVPLNKVETVLRRSGLNDATFELDGDTKEMYEQYYLPPATTMLEARKIAATLQDKAFGIQTRFNGFAIRIGRGQQEAVRSVLLPALREALGDTLSALTHNEAYRYILYGIPSSFSDIDTINNIAFEAGGWKCKPTGRCTGKDKCMVPGRDNIMAIASTPPPRSNITLRYAHQRIMVNIVSVPAPTKMGLGQQR